MHTYEPTQFLHLFSSFVFRRQRRRIRFSKLHYSVSISFLMEPNENGKKTNFVSGAEHGTRATFTIRKQN